MKKAFWLLLLLFPVVLFAQKTDDRYQYKGILKNAYFNINLGYIHYPFTNAHLEPGYTAASITTPPVAVRIVLFGYRFNDHLAAQLSYGRPVKYARFHDINGDMLDHYAWMHTGSLSLKGNLPLSSKWSIYGEAGLGISTRSGFEIQGKPVMTDVNKGVIMGGAGLDYAISRKIDLTAGVTYFPEIKKEKQPHTLFYSAGFRLNMRPLPEAKVEANRARGYIFHKNLLQFGYATNGLGYEVNNFVSKKVPIFWGGSVELRRGATLKYQRNLFHTGKVFALDAGVSAGWWQTKINRDEYWSASIYPVFRFNLLRTKAVDGYLMYSVAGPSYISRDKQDGLDTGNGFTFQDFMGMGFFLGQQKHWNAEVHINHFSNGNIFPENAGVKIPTTFTLGYAW